MSNAYNVIVIGSGPAGLAAAITAARGGKKVLLVERNEKLAKKIYATGNGKCNFLNKKASDFESVMDFCSSIGIVPTEEDEGRLYPRSKEARSVVNCFETNLKKSGVEIELDFETASVQKTEQGFVVESKQGKSFTAENVVIATGGKAGIQFGCYGDGYKWAGDFGLSVVKPIPALVGLEVKEDLSILAGTRVFAKASLYDGDKVIAEDTGEVQFTKESISGICVMNLSKNVRLNQTSNFSLHLDLYPEYSMDELLSLFINQKNAAGCAMEGLVPEAIHDYLHTKISEKEHGPKFMAALSKDLSFAVSGTKGWKDAQVTSGGVDFKDLDDNYQSKKISGLYFAGEVLNYDGPCGGYNIGFAIASGLKVGKALK